MPGDAKRRRVARDAQILEIPRSDSYTSPRVTRRERYW
jgi:hypothetical protein